MNTQERTPNFVKVGTPIEPTMVNDNADDDEDDGDDDDNDDDDDDDDEDDDDDDEILCCLYRPMSTSSLHAFVPLTLYINPMSQCKHSYETMQALRVLLRR